MMLERGPQKPQRRPCLSTGVGLLQREVEFWVWLHQLGLTVRVCEEGG